MAHREHPRGGGRLVVQNDGFPEIEVCCNGRVHYTALVCALDVGHEGDCWSQHKNVNFNPETGGPQ